MTVGDQKWDKLKVMRRVMTLSSGLVSLSRS